METEKRGSKSLSVIPQWRLITTAGVQNHSEIQSLVDKFNTMLEEASKEVIGTTSVELDSRQTSVRSRETAMGNLVAEAMRWSVGADVEFQMAVVSAAIAFMQLERKSPEGISLENFLLVIRQF